MFCINYWTVKNFGGQKVWRKGPLQGIGEKNFGEYWLASPIFYHRLTVKWCNSEYQWTKKRTPYFPGFVLCHVLIVCCLMMTRCTVESMICGYYEYTYKQTIIWKWTGPLKHCNIDIVTSILMQNKLKHTSHWCACLTLQKINGKLAPKKFGELFWFAKVFSPPKFLLYGTL